MRPKQTFSDAERVAMQERARELAQDGGVGEQAVLAKIAAMDDVDRVIAESLHALVKMQAPQLTPKTWYGMPAYANQEGKVVCFFQAASKFKTRYATLGFSDQAQLDAGKMWPTTYALTQLTAIEEDAVAQLLKRAMGMDS